MLIELERSIRSILKFIFTFFRVFKGGVEGQWRLFIALCASDVLAAVCQGAVILVLVAATKTATVSEESVSVFPILDYVATFLGGMSGGFELSQRELVIYIAVICSVAMLLISVCGRFLAATMSRKLARRYHERSVTLLLKSFYGSSRFGLLTETVDFQSILRAVMQYCIHTSNAMEALSRLFQNFIFAIAFFAFAFMVEWRIMAIMTACGLIFLPVIMLVARHIHAVAGTFFDSSAKEMGQSTSKLLRTIEGLYLPNEDRSMQVVTFMASDPVQAFFDNYDGIQLASERMSFLTGLVRTSIFGLGLILITIAVNSGWAEVSIIVAFAGSLTIAFSYMQSLFSRLANLNLYYPQVVRFFVVCDRGSSTLLPQNDELSECSPSRSLRRVIKGSFSPDNSPQGLVDELEVGPGTLVDFLMARRLSRYEMGQWLKPFRQNSKPAIQGDDVVLATTQLRDLSPMILNDLDTAVRTAGLGGLDALADRVGVGADLTRWRNKQASSEQVIVLHADVLKSLPGELYALLILAIAASAAGDVVFLEASDLKYLPKENWCEIRSVLEKKLIFISRRANMEPIIEADHHIVLVPEGKIVLFKKGTDQETLISALPEETTGTIDPDDLDVTALL